MILLTHPIEQYQASIKGVFLDQKKLTKWRKFHKIKNLYSLDKFDDPLSLVKLIMGP